MSIDFLVNEALPKVATQPHNHTFTFQSASPVIRINRKLIQASAVRDTTGRPQAFSITNIGRSPFTLDSGSFQFTGPDADSFAIVGGSIPRRIAVGKRAQFFLALRPGASAPLDRILTATLDIVPTGQSTSSGRITLRGLATVGEGGLSEPSLARLMELFQYSINVGDSSPESTLLDINGPTDETFAPRFERATAAPVTVTTIAQFVSTTPTVAGRFGTYTPGVPGSRKQLLELAGLDGQTVNPTVNGATSFDPGTSPFSVWAEAPTFLDSGISRIIYGEDALNTWEPNANNRRKVRVYQLSEGGQAVANAYVVTFEEYPPQNDQNDYMFVLRNVKTSSSRPVLGLVSLEGIDDPTVLSMNRIENVNQTFGNAVHDTAKVRIVNTGSSSLQISSFSITGTNAADFQIVNSPGSTSVASGATLDLTVQYVANGGDVSSATLNISSNDPARSVTSISLNGFWQSHSENNTQGISQEPSLAEIFKTLGFKTSAVNSGQNINGNGAAQAVGDEILSSYWKAADRAKPVYVRQVAGFHQQGTTSEVAWFDQARPYFYPSNPRYPGAENNGDRNTLYFTNVNDGQSLFQRKKDTTDPAAAWFTTSATFGFRVDSEYSDDSLNNQVQGDVGGHHMRFYPARNARGDYLPNTYLMTMDFSSINFDYNDNIFLISNLQPATRTAAVNGLAGYTDSGKVVLDWADVAGASSYVVQRSTSANTGFRSITSSLLTESFFVDTTATAGRAWYYRVIAIDAEGDSSMPANTRVLLS